MTPSKGANTFNRCKVASAKAPKVVSAPSTPNTLTGAIGGLAAAAAQTPQPELNLRADRDTPYGKIAGVMSQARTAGIAKMGFVTQPEGEK